MFFSRQRYIIREVAGKAIFQINMMLFLKLFPKIRRELFFRGARVRARANRGRALLKEA
jgi:hypothetical protein